MSSDNAEQYLSWLSPTMRKDYIACEIGGQSRADRARDRGVDPATVSKNVTRAKRRLEEIVDDDHSSGGTDRILLPECDNACRRVARVYVDKTGQNLCDECGDSWSEDEKIPIRIDDGTEADRDG